MNTKIRRGKASARTHKQYKKKEKYGIRLNCSFSLCVGFGEFDHYAHFHTLHIRYVRFANACDVYYRNCI